MPFLCIHSVCVWVRKGNCCCCCCCGGRDRWVNTHSKWNCPTLHWESLNTRAAFSSLWLVQGQGMKRSVPLSLTYTGCVQCTCDTHSLHKRRLTYLYWMCVCWLKCSRTFCTGTRWRAWTQSRGKSNRSATWLPWGPYHHTQQIAEHQSVCACSVSPWMDEWLHDEMDKWWDHSRLPIHSLFLPHAARSQSAAMKAVSRVNLTVLVTVETASMLWHYQLLYWEDFHQQLALADDDNGLFWRSAAVRTKWFTLCFR